MRRLLADIGALDDDELRDQARGCPDSTPLAEADPGHRITVFGRLKAVSYTPRQHVPTLQAELVDGTGTLTLVWLGRRRIPGIEPGRVLQARGCVAESPDGPVIFNPRYDLWP